MITCKNCRNYSPKKEMCRISGGGVPEDGVSEDGVICKDFRVIPAKRDLDGVYFRVKRGGRWGNVCFSDMTKEERDEVLGTRPTEWWKSLAYIMADCLRAVGDQFEIVSNQNYEDE